MIRYLPDVNLVVASLRADHPHHCEALNFLQSAKADGGEFVVPVEVVASIVRSWVAAADAEVVGHPAAAFTVLTEFARTLELSPRRVPDALLASSAIVLRATLVSFDRGLSGYPGVSALILEP